MVKTISTISTHSGQVISVKNPQRERARFTKLDPVTREEIMDTRPMAASVAFAEELTTDQRIQQMIAAAEARVEARIAKAADSEIEFYDEDDFFGVDDDTDDRFTAPGEFIFDPSLGREVPRAVSSIVKASKKAVQKQKELPPKVPTSAPDSPPVDPKVSKGGGSDPA